MTVTLGDQDAKALDVALAGALSQIAREFGKGSVMRMGDPGAQVRCSVIPTGALPLDLALEIGRVPRGRIADVFGPESSAKPTLIYPVLHDAQTPVGLACVLPAAQPMETWFWVSEVGLCPANVTEPVWAKALPHRSVAPGSNEMLASVRRFPAKTVSDPSVAELLTIQYSSSFGLSPLTSTVEPRLPGTPLKVTTLYNS